MNKYSFRLSLTVSQEFNAFKQSGMISRQDGPFIEVCEAKSIIELITKFNLIVIKIQDELHEKEMKELRNKDVNDDIPF